jgi:hypothetical protein
MAAAKTATLTFRIKPGLKEALRTAASRVHRFNADRVDFLIWDYCGRNGIAISEQGALFDKGLRLSAEAPAGKRGRKRDGDE